MWLTWFVVTAIVLLRAEVWAYEYTSKSCRDLKPMNYGRTKAQTYPSPFVLRVIPAQYKPNETVTVELRDPTGQLQFEGAVFKIYCDKCKKRGTFSSDTSTPGTPFACGRRRGLKNIAIKSDSHTPMRVFRAHWTPNFSHSKPVNIGASVVYNNTVWWNKIKSEDLRKFSGTVTTTSKPTAKPSATEGSTNKPGSGSGTGSTKGPGSGSGTGKPCDLKPQNIGNTTAQPSQSPFILRVIPVQYEPNDTVTVELKDPTGQLQFEGAVFKIYCDKCKKRGTFSSDTSTPGTPFACGRRRGLKNIAIKSDSHTPMRVFRAHWTPNFSHSKPVNIGASVVYNNTVWWNKIKSEDLRKCSGTVTTTSEPTTKPSATEGSTNKPGSGSGTGSTKGPGSGSGTGKPCDLKPQNIGNTTAQPSQSPFLLRVIPAQYERNQTVTVELKDPTGQLQFEGAVFKIYCDKCKKRGIFSSDTSTPGTPFACGRRRGLKNIAIKSDSHTPMRVFRAHWTPNFSHSKPVNIGASVVYNNTVWWNKIKSEDLRKCSGTVTTTSEPTTKPSATEGSTNKPGSGSGTGSTKGPGSGSGTGKPCDLKPQNIGNTTAQPSQSPFLLRVIPAQYERNQTVTVELKDPTGQLQFEGAVFKIYCDKCKKRGIFSSDTSTPGTPFACGRRRGLKNIAIKSDSHTPMRVFRAHWTPNFSHSKPVNIGVLVVYNNTVWWNNIRSEDLRKWPGSITTTAEPTIEPSAPEGSTNKPGSGSETGSRMSPGSGSEIGSTISPGSGTETRTTESPECGCETESTSTSEPRSEGLEASTAKHCNGGIRCNSPLHPVVYIFTLILTLMM